HSLQRCGVVALCIARAGWPEHGKPVRGRRQRRSDHANLSADRGGTDAVDRRAEPAAVAAAATRYHSLMRCRAHAQTIAGRVIFPVTRGRLNSMELFLVRGINCPRGGDSMMSAKKKKVSQTSAQHAPAAEYSGNSG